MKTLDQITEDLFKANRASCEIGQPRCFPHDYVEEPSILRIAIAARRRTDNAVHTHDTNVFAAICEWFRPVA